jgi:hypothetical protein
VATATATLTKYLNFVGTAAGALAATADITTVIQLLGTAALSSTAAADVTTAILLQGRADTRCASPAASLTVGGADCSALEAEIVRLQAIIDELTKRSGTLRHSDGGTLR